MSEYQYYEFLAIDRPLSGEQMEALRKLTSRATITPTRLQNDYQWGNFKGDPLKLMAQYFDAHVYVANWGTHEFLLGFPRSLIDLKTASLYEIEPHMVIRELGEKLILEFTDPGEDGGGDWEDTGESWMSSLVGLRPEIMNGDMRALYLAWLYAAEYGELEDEAIEPPVPPGLGQLSASLDSLTGFLGLDDELLAVAAEASAPLTEKSSHSGELEQWIRALSTTNKDDLLIRLAGGEDYLRAELLRRFRDETAGDVQTPRATAGSRTVGELVAAAEERQERARQLREEQKAQERAHERVAQARKRAAYLDGLVGREQRMMSEIDALVNTKQPNSYDRATSLLKDLRDVAERTHQQTEFLYNLGELRASHAKKARFIERLNAAGLVAPVTTGLFQTPG